MLILLRIERGTKSKRHSWRTPSSILADVNRSGASIAIHFHLWMPGFYFRVCFAGRRERNRSLLKAGSKWSPHPKPATTTAKKENTKRRGRGAGCVRGSFVRARRRGQIRRGLRQGGRVF